MEKLIASLVPSADDLLNLQVEEVGWVLLVHLTSLGDQSGDGRVWGAGRIHQYNFFNHLDHHPVYGTRRDDVTKALLEAWGWLQHEGFLVREVMSGGTETCFLSRRAKELQTRADVGVELMRQAFRAVNRPNQAAQTPGPLTDANLPVAEQEGIAHLFAGAIGLYKNPQSHRYVPTSAAEAAEVVLFASHLLRIVDRVSSSDARS